MDFSAFDTKKIDDYKKQAKEQWGNTNAYKEFQEKDKNRTKEDNQMIAQGLMDQFVEIGKLMDQTPESDSVQEKVKLLQDYITNNYYTCTNEIFAGLGQMYGAGGEFTENINKVAGAGCAEFTAKAIEYYCMRK